ITIYNGYDFSEIKKINKMAKDSNEKRFLFVGRLDEQKDPLTLIKAFELIEKKYPNVYLDIVGDGELKGHCEELVKKLKIQDKVIFHGWVEKPYSFYLNCNVFICPSKYEAFGFIFVEAAYFKKPIITTSVEGIPEVVVDSKMGYLIKPGDFLDLSKRMTNLLESNSLCVAMGEYGHKYVTSNFDIEKCVEKYQAVYD
ncbi:glycosyltransferase, partial [Escherichia coli]